MAKTLSKLEPADALYCAKIFNDYFGQFERIDQYMRDQKLAQIDTTVATALPGMGPEQDIFDDFTISPEDMDFTIVEGNGKDFETLLNVTSSHTNMASIHQHKGTQNKYMNLSVYQLENTNLYYMIRWVMDYVVNMVVDNTA